jgi:hypothetical protein
MIENSKPKGEEDKPKGEEDKPKVEEVKPKVEEVKPKVIFFIVCLCLFLSILSPHCISIVEQSFVWIYGIL